MNDGADRFFVDTNLLLYSLDDSDSVKHTRARLWMKALWESDSGRLSWQVLNEFYANAVGKLKALPASAQHNVEALIAWRPVDFGLAQVRRAWYWSDHAGTSYWDSLILAAAEASGCRYLLSEDFQTGRKYGMVTVINPFLSSPVDFQLE
jgi:predicted nucleic acid-binding protein